MKVALIIFISVFYLLTLLPGVQFLLTPFPKQRLDGLKIKRVRPEVSVDAVLAGEFQPKIENWFTQNTGLWGYFVRSENQINFSLFRQISQSYNSKVILGKENTLFQRDYVDDYNGKGTESDQTLEVRVQQLRKVQDFLGSRGIVFYVLISPAKISFQPERIPDSYLVKDLPGTQRNYYRFVKLLEKHGINVVDGPRYFRERAEEFSDGIFAKSAAHWNDVATCEITSHLLRKIEVKLAKKLVSYSCSPIKIRDMPRPPDRDLAEIVNIWSTKKLFEPTPYPVTKKTSADDVYKPNMLLVGTSFLWSVLRFYDYHQVYQSRDMYYYFKTKHSYPSHTKVSVNREKLDWERDILSKDIVLIEVNETMVEQTGFEFVDDAIRYADATTKNSIDYPSETK